MSPDVDLVVVGYFSLHRVASETTGSTGWSACRLVEGPITTTVDAEFNYRHPTMPRKNWCRNRACFGERGTR